MKTHSGAKKRFKITGSGKILRGQQNNQHGFNKKGNAQIRRLGKDVELHTADKPRIERLLGRK